ncbi:MAG: hypothetical protein VYA34_01855 [Myxococcota bacterium]|nr:hypothetical protein [Myxococcota bacterium]
MFFIKRGGRFSASLFFFDQAFTHLVGEEKVHQIYSQMQVSGSKYGMQTISNVLSELVEGKIIRPREAIVRSLASEELENMLTRL